jgi:deazaflavin-dependent oxidoreductase (nitroreductase family)
MPIPMAVARFNRRVTNRISGPLAGRIPVLALVEHRGRRSGTRYRTPVLLFHDGADLVIALTYGPDTDWVYNVLAAGSATITDRNQRIPVANPRLEAGANAMAPLPRFVGFALKRFGVDHLLRLTPTAALE